jgi:hypothetical protein
MIACSFSGERSSVALAQTAPSSRAKSLASGFRAKT